MENKISYRLPQNFPMDDMCHCCANCSTPCGRKQKPVEMMFTVSNFSSVCSEYKEK